MPIDPADVVRQWWQGFNDRGEPPLELCDPEIEIRNPDDFLIANAYHGHEGVRRWAEDAWAVVADLRFELDRVEDAGGGAVVSLQRACGTTRHSELPIEAPWSAVWRVAGDRVLSARGYTTWAEAERAAGLS